jgi:transcriptional regulator with XRE-family HTH domain
LSDPSAINPPMTDEHTIERVRELRARGLSPKEIARNLGIKRAVVTDIVRALAAEREGAGKEDEHVDCLLNVGWSTGLKIDGRPEWHDPATDESIGGLITALVARRRRHRRGATVCVYLLDVYCLGIKNAMGPDSMDEQALRRLATHAFSGYETPPIPAPIELVRELVLGAADYAHQLGFAPHPDFEQARPHLGPWAGPSAITFGRDGKPTYISGPYDDADHIIRTLQRAVGRKGFNYTIGADLGQLPLAG